MGFFFLLVGLPPSSPLFPYTTLFRSVGCCVRRLGRRVRLLPVVHPTLPDRARDRRRLRDLPGDRKSTRLNSSHSQISYAVFCLKKKILIKINHRADK